MRMQATWNGAVLAESDKTIVVEGNHYFPPEALNREYFEENTRHTICPWKGQASYYDVQVEDKVNKSAAWYYPDPSPPARHIHNYVAFWNGVQVKPVEAVAKESADGASDGGLKRVIGRLFG